MTALKTVCSVLRNELRRRVTCSKTFSMEQDREGSDDMGEREEIKSYLYELIGDEGCGASCSEAEVYEDEDGWKLNMEGFMEPWKIGRTVDEARASLKEYARMGFGLK